MKSIKLLSTILLCMIMLQQLQAQDANLEKDQNPRYKESQEKYSKLADSLNKQQATTLQNTYKAIDPLQDLRDARRNRKLNRINRVRQVNYYPNNNWGFNNPYFGYDAFYHPFNNRRFNSWYPSLNLGWNSNWNSPFGLGLNCWWF